MKSKRLKVFSEYTGRFKSTQGTEHYIITTAPPNTFPRSQCTNIYV